MTSHYYVATDLFVDYDDAVEHCITHMIPTEHIYKTKRMWDFLRIDYGGRGGGLEISLTNFGYPDEKMAVYQNYLGGGMLGRIGVNDTIRRQSYRDKVKDEINTDLDEIGNDLKQFFHYLTNPDSEWESTSFEQNQKLPTSGY